MEKEKTTTKAYVIVPKKFYAFKLGSYDYDIDSFEWHKTRKEATQSYEFDEDEHKIIEVTLSFAKQPVHKCNCSECTYNK